jgi:hypothetical protein
MGDAKLLRQKGDARKTSSTVASDSKKRSPIRWIGPIPLAMILKGESSDEWGWVDMTRFIPHPGPFKRAEKNRLLELRINEVSVGGRWVL